MKFSKKSGCKPASTDDIVLASRQRGLVSFEMDGVTYGDLSSFDDDNITLAFYNVSETTTRTSLISSITLPFDIPELPEFFTSWTFFAISSLCFILGILTCCCCKSSANDDKNVSLLDESFSKEPPLARKLSNIRNLSINSLSSAAKVGSVVDNKKQERESIELCRASDSTRSSSLDDSSISRSRKSAACQTSFDKQSNKSQSSALNRILQTLSNGVIAAKQHNVALADKEEVLEEGKAEAQSDSSSSSKSKTSKRSSRSTKTDKSVILAPIDEKIPTAEALPTVSKSSSNSQSKKSSVSKRISLKIHKMVFGGGKTGKGTEGAMKTAVEYESHRNKSFISQGTGVQKNSRQVVTTSEENGVVHEMCMAVGEGVHLCVSPKMLLEDQIDEVQSSTDPNISETKEFKGATDAMSDELHGESNNGIVHSSLINLGQGIHNILPYSETQETGIGHDTCMAVGIGVQNLGEGFYSMISKK
jgi:hypothetical protein